MRNASILLSISLQSPIPPSMIAEMANIEEPSHGVPRGDIMEALFEVKAPASSTPINGVFSSDVTVDPSRSLWFRLYVPTSAVAASDAVPAVVYYHGGGFVIWSPDRKPYDDLCRRLARELSAVVVSASYRMAPEYRCPTQYDDGFETLKFIDRTKIDGFPPNADIGKCFLAGDSSGGNMSHHMAVRAVEHESQIGADIPHLYFEGRGSTQGWGRMVAQMCLCQNQSMAMSTSRLMMISSSSRSRRKWKASRQTNKDKVHLFVDFGKTTDYHGTNSFIPDTVDRSQNGYLGTALQARDGKAKNEKPGILAFCLHPALDVSPSLNTKAAQPLHSKAGAFKKC
ncbi:hypothetical protein Ancab_002349 [Ancistrocladus abbreviatus]